jgi:hypothetical protein
MRRHSGQHLVSDRVQLDRKFIGCGVFRRVMANINEQAAGALSNLWPCRFYLDRSAIGRTIDGGMLKG